MNRCFLLAFSLLVIGGFIGCDAEPPEQYPTPVVLTSPTKIPLTEYVRESRPLPDTAVLPEWVWTGRPLYDHIRRYIADLDQAGVKGFMIRPGRHLKVGYLFDPWMERVDVALRAAAEREMEVWIVEDLEISSRVVVETFPEVQGRVLVEERLPASHREPAPRLPKRDGELETIVYAEETRNGIRNTSTYKGDASQPGDTIAPSTHNGTWHAHVYRRADLADQQIAVNFLHPEAGNRYVEGVLEAYRERFGPLLGSTLRGFVLRQTGFLRQSGALPWTEDFATAFSSRRDYDIAPFLPYLWHDSAHETPIAFARVDYFRTRDELYRERFLRPIRDWAHEHGAVLAGDLGLGASLAAMAHGSGDSLAHQGMVAVPVTDGHSGVLGGRLGTSAAVIHGHRDNIQLALPPGSIDAETDTLGNEASLLQALGGTVIAPRGPFGYEAAVDFNLALLLPNKHPQWPAMGETFDDIETRSTRLRGTVEQPLVGVVLPLHSFWASSVPARWSVPPVEGAVQEAFRNAVDVGFAPLVLSEGVLEQGNFEGPPGKASLVFSSRAKGVQALLVPAMTHLTPEIAAFLREFQKQGGQVIRDADARWELVGKNITEEDEKVLEELTRRSLVRKPGWSGYLNTVSAAAPLRFIARPRSIWTAYRERDEGTDAWFANLGEEPHRITALASGDNHLRYPEGWHPFGAGLVTSFFHGHQTVNIFLLGPGETRVLETADVPLPEDLGEVGPDGVFSAPMDLTLLEEGAIHRDRVPREDIRPVPTIRPLRLDDHWSLTVGDERYDIRTPESWTTVHPYLKTYSGLGAYRFKLERIGEPKAIQGWLDLGAVAGEPRVIWNGEELVPHPSLPYRYPLEGLRAEGNLTIVVANTPGNEILIDPQPSGLIGPVFVHVVEGLGEATVAPDLFREYLTFPGDGTATLQVVPGMKMPFKVKLGRDPTALDLTDLEETFGGLVPGETYTYQHLWQVPGEGLQESEVRTFTMR